MFERCLYFNVNALARTVNKLWEQSFAEFDLSPAHAYLLRLVLSQPKITQKQIAEELKLEKSTVTRFIDALENRGLLQRYKTGRETLIKPTSRAKKIATKLEQTGNRLYKQMMSIFGKESLVELVAQLRETNDKLR